MAKFGVRDRPRVLIVDCGSLPGEVSNVVAEMVPTVGCVDLAGLRGTDLDEWDAVVTDAAGHRLLDEYGTDRGCGLIERLAILAFVDGSAGTAIVDRWNLRRRRFSGPDDSGPGSTATQRVAIEQPQRRSTEYSVDDALDDELVQLIRDTVIPAVGQREVYWTFTLPRQLGTALGADRAGRPLALRYPRGSDIFVDDEQPDGRGVGTGGQAFVLPADVKQPGRWVRWVLRQWRAHDGAVFGGLRDWDQQPHWLTAPQRAARDERATLAAERSAADAAFDQRECELREQLQHADRVAADGERRLLTATGDALVEAVTAALARLGFDVEPRDEHNGTRRLEDLRVRDPGDAGWLALVEVRSYGSGGGKITDLNAKLPRYDKEYLRETGTDASALWFIVNHSHQVDPGHRPEPMASEAATVEHFAADRGSLIDTRTLFRLVTAPDLPASEDLGELRQRIRDLTGRWPVEPTGLLAVDGTGESASTAGG